MASNCADCFLLLESYQDDLGLIWLGMCNKSNEEGFINLVKTTPFRYEFRILERLGFILTNEHPLCLQVRMNGLHEHEDEIIYCLDFIEHYG